MASAEEKTSSWTAQFIYESELHRLKGLSRLQACESIDERFAFLQQSIQILSSIRNDYSPIHVLPDELLADMFLQVVSGVQEQYDSRSKDHALVPVALSCVCRRWRSICLETSGLWTFIDLRYYKASSVFIQRSKRAFLDVFVDTINVAKAMSIVPLLQPDAGFSRLRKLEMHVPLESLKAVCPTLVADVPNLQSLILKQRYGKAVPPPDQNYILPETLFMQSTPALETLHLDRVTVPLHSPLLMGLRHLVLKRQNPLTYPWIDDLVEVLKRCPELQTLDLRDAGPMLPPGSDYYSPPLTRAELPSLEHLILHNASIDVSYVLAHVVVPATVNIELTAELHDSSDDFTTVLPANCLSMPAITALNELWFCVGDFNCIGIYGKSAPDAPPSFALTMSVFEGMLKPRIFLTQLHEYFPAHQLEHFHVSECATHVSADTWRVVLSGLTGLRTLTARESGERVRHAQLMSALKLAPVGLDEAKGSAGVVCPLLKTLHFFGLDLVPDVVGALRACCSYRKVKGAPLEELIMDGAKDDDLERFRNIVPFVGTRMPTNIQA